MIVVGQNIVLFSKNFLQPYRLTRPVDRVFSTYKRNRRIKAYSVDIPVR